SVPLVATGGFKTRTQALSSLSSGAVDMVGVARAMILNPALANSWLSETAADPDFPRFEAPPLGGVTAWYTTLLTAVGNDNESNFALDISSAIRLYEERDALRCVKWRKKFSAL
ncbi:MAG: hypothetical protein MJK13_08960, partial [Pseudomonadales bacterium]|nr:hypothetical protein [Pseudomonadales bacterium]